jgi:hypothetical protein
MTKYGSCSYFHPSRFPFQCSCPDGMFAAYLLPPVLLRAPAPLVNTVRRLSNNKAQLRHRIFHPKLAKYRGYGLVHYLCISMLVVSHCRVSIYYQLVLNRPVSISLCQGSRAAKHPTNAISRTQISSPLDSNCWISEYVGLNVVAMTRDGSELEAVVVSGQDGLTRH